MMATITHRIHSADLNCTIDLDNLTHSTTNIIFKKTPFRVCIWNCKKIRFTCMVFHTGKIVVHGPRESVRKYARLLQRLGFPVRLRFIKLITRSMTYNLGREINYNKIIQHFNISYDPELFHGLVFKKGRISFTLFKSGKIIITGVTRDSMIESIVDPTIIEISLCS